MLTAIGFIVASVLCLAVIAITLFVFGMFFTLVMEGFEGFISTKGGDEQ